MTRINTNLVSLQAQNNLYANENSLQTSLQRLSTGLRINSGKDDPSGLIASSVLGSEVVGIGQAITNSQRANNIVATADAALSQVGTLLNNISGLVQASANKGAISAAEIAANQVQVDSAIDSIDRIGQTTVFGGDQLLNGTKAFNVTGNLGSAFQSASDITVNSFDPSLHTGSPNSDATVKITQSATKATVNLVGDSQGAAGAGLANLSLDTGTTHATSTLTTNDFTIGGTKSLNALSTTSTRATRVITGASIAALGGTASDTLTLHVSGNLGNADVTVKLGGATGIATDDQNLLDAINAQSANTGVIAIGSGGNGDITLTSSNVGATATVGVTATAGTYAGTNSTLSLDATGFSAFTGVGAGTLSFNVNGVDSSGNAKTVNVVVDASAVKTASNFASVVGGLLTAGGLAAGVTSSGSTVTFTASQASATAITITGVRGKVAADVTAVNSAVTGATSTPGIAAGQTAFNAAVAPLAAGTNASFSTRKITQATLAAVTADSSSTVDFTIAGTGSVTLTGKSLTGTTGIDTATNLASLINANTGTTGVSAALDSSGNVILSSTTAGSGGTANVTFTTYSGSQSTSVINTSNLNTLTGSGAGTLGFKVTGSAGNFTFSLDASTVAAQGGQALVTAINLQTATTGVTASINNNGDVLLTNTAADGATSPVFVSAVTGGAGDVTIFNGDINKSQVTGTAANDATTLAALNGAVGTLTAGSDAAPDSTVFTITGNKGTATIDTAALGGNDTIINNNPANNNGITALTNLINTREGSTGVTASVDSSGNIVLTSDGAGSSSKATVTATGGGSDATIVSSGNALATQAGTDGTSNQVTLQLIGDQGRAVITVDNNAVINDSGALANAINAVTAQTGITATGSGAGGNVTLSSLNYGSTATLSLSAIAATNAADITLFNAGATQQTTAGLDVAGTVTTNKGSGSFTGQGANITYADSSLNFSATSAPSLAAPTAATTTILGTGGAGAGISNLTSGANGTNTISFTVQGSVNGVLQPAVNITGINVAQLKGDSRTLVDAINKVSLQTGVTASTQAVNGSYALSDIVLTSTTAGPLGKVSIQATAATAAADVTTFNNAGLNGTFTATADGTAAPTTAVASFNVTGGALFQIGPQVNFTNQVNVNITDLDTHLLGKNFGTTGALNLHDLRTGGSQVLSSTDLTDAATIVQQAISQIATLRGQLGALQANVLESNISSQQAALEQVTSAQSSIQDTDFAKETANLTRAQVLVQAGTSVLAIANQQPQSVLALLPRQ